MNETTLGFETSCSYIVADLNGADAWIVVEGAAEGTSNSCTAWL